MIHSKLELRLRTDPSMGMLTSPYYKGSVKLPDLEVPKIKKSQLYLEMNKTPRMTDQNIQALIKKYPPVANVA